MGWILLEAVRHHLPHTGGHGGRQVGSVLPQDCLHRIHRCLTFEGPRAPEHLVQHHAEAEDVAAVIGIQSAHLLRRHVPDRAHDDAGTRQRGRHCRVGMSRCLRHPRQTEIEDLRAAVPGQQDVLRLQIAVHDAGRMRRGQAAGDLGGDVERLPQAEPGVAQRLAVDELADDVALADVVDGDDIGVAQGRDGTGLDLEPLTA